MSSNQPQQATRVAGGPPKPAPTVAGAQQDEDGDPARKDFDAGDPRAVAARAESSKQREVRRIEGMRKLVENEEGRLWLWDLLAFCGVSKTSFDGTSRTYFNEGGRNVGLRIQADLTRHFPEKYVQMLREEGGLK